jgi:hypothetical protein
MKAFAAEHRLNFPYVIDETQSVARAYEAVCTPDFFGFNSKDELQYRGRMDESRLNQVKGARRELYEAMKAIAETERGPQGPDRVDGLRDQVGIIRLPIADHRSSRPCQMRRIMVASSSAR